MENAEVFHPAKEARYSGDIDEDTAEDHHADPDECRQHCANCVLASRRTEHQRNRRASNTGQDGVQNIEREMLDADLKSFRNATMSTFLLSCELILRDCVEMCVIHYLRQRLLRAFDFTVKTNDV